MKPISPNLYWLDEGQEVVYAKDQPEYLPLPAHRMPDGLVITCWKLSWRERVLVLFGKHIFLKQLTFNTPLQPLRLTVDVPSELKRPMIPLSSCDG